MNAKPTTKRIEPAPRTEVLGAPVHIVDAEGVLRLMEQWIGDRARKRWIAVTGSHGALEAHKHADFRAVLETADISVADGRWAARLAAKKMSCATRQVRGADLLSAFCALSAEKGYTNYFYGDTEETLALACGRLKQAYPGVRIVGAWSPPFRPLTPQEDAEVIARINAANPDVLWVALGLPKQERWSSLIALDSTCQWLSPSARRSSFTAGAWPPRPDGQAMPAWNGFGGFCGSLAPSGGGR